MQDFLLQFCWNEFFSFGFLSTSLHFNCHFVFNVFEPQSLITVVNFASNTAEFMLNKTIIDSKAIINVEFEEILMDPLNSSTEAQN